MLEPSGRKGGVTLSRCEERERTDLRHERPADHRRAALRIERERRIRTTGKVRHEAVHGLTSLPARRATPEAVPKLVRGHWRIESRLHHVRDVSCREDQCRVRTGHLPRNLACLTSLAISIVRIQGRFGHLPQAHRHYARRPHRAVRRLPEPRHPGSRGRHRGRR